MPPRPRTMLATCSIVQVPYSGPTSTTLLLTFPLPSLSPLPFQIFPTTESRAEMAPGRAATAVRPSTRWNTTPPPPPPPPLTEARRRSTVGRRGQPAAVWVGAPPPPCLPSSSSSSSGAVDRSRAQPRPRATLPLPSPIFTDALSSIPNDRGGGVAQAVVLIDLELPSPPPPFFTLSGPRPRWQRHHRLRRSGPRPRWLRRHHRRWPDPLSLSFR